MQEFEPLQSEIELTSPEELLKRAEIIAQQLITNMSPTERACLRDANERFHRDSEKWLQQYIDSLDQTEGNK